MKLTINNEPYECLKKVHIINKTLFLDGKQVIENNNEFLIEFNGNGEMTEEIFKELETYVYKETQDLEDLARHSKSNEAKKILKELEMYRQGFYKKIPGEYKKYIKKIQNKMDPEYQKYLELKKKFE